MLGKVAVIKNETASSDLGIRPAADEAYQLTVDGMDEASPINTSIVHQTIERVLLAGEQLAQRTVLILRRGLDGKERLQDKQLHQLDEGELAVRILNRTHRSGLYDELFHHFVYRIDRLAGVIMFEIVFEFRDYLSIFVHG
jgi:hypothetical protein